MTAAPRFEIVSVDDYLAGESQSEVKHEYLDGLVYAMAGAKIRHNRIASRVLGALYQQLSHGLCEAFNSDTKIRVRTRGKTFFYYPDVSVVCNSNPEDESYQDKPVLVVEVMSETTRRIDEGEKRDNYLAIDSLQYYVLLEQDRQAAVVYARGPDGEFSRKIFSNSDAVIRLPQINIELPLSEIYLGISFPAG
jgi:Uma2 family endonuclease